MRLLRTDMLADIEWWEGIQHIPNDGNRMCKGQRHEGVEYTQEI